MEATAAATLVQLFLVAAVASQRGSRISPMVQMPMAIAVAGICFAAMTFASG